MYTNVQIKETHLSYAIDATEQNAQYDEKVKEALSDKQVLARILKFLVPELKDYDYESIMAFIEGKPEVSIHPVLPGLPVLQKIVGMNTESNIVGEGKVYFDIRFNVVIPGQEPVKIIVNLEAQKDSNTGYSFESRGIFYCARMISEQKDTEFRGDNYDNIKKVYSIWICMNPSIKYANTITEYSMAKRDIVGTYPDFGKYDLLSVVIIRLAWNSKKEVKHELLNMLDTLLSQELDKETKKEKLENEFGMVMTETLEKGIDEMCNLSDLIVKQTTERVQKETAERVEKETTERVKTATTYENLVEAVENVMESFQVSLEKACSTMKTTVDNYYVAKRYLNI